MIERYFGIPQYVIRSGLWTQMRPSEWSLYVCLLHESERYSTRKLQKTDATLCKLAGLSSRAFCNARKKLQEYKLVICERGRGNIYSYTICNPETGLPWPGDPKARIPYVKKQTAGAGPEALRPVPKQEAREDPITPSCKPESRPIQSYGIPISFGKTC